MNISLRQVKMNACQTMFITSTGTVLFTSNMMYDRCGRSSTTITSVDDQGLIEAGLIKWNPNAEAVPSLFVGKRPMDWRTIGKDGTSYINFRASDKRLYWWRTTNGVTILSACGPSRTSIAVAYDDAHYSSTIDPAEANVVLCIQPTGFHLLHEIVVTFILFERLCRKTRADYDRKAGLVLNRYRESCVLSEQPRVRLSNDSHLTRIQHLSPVALRSCEYGTRHHAPRLRTPHLTRSTADLTGELSRRYKYPSAYGGYGDIWKCDWIKDSRVIEVAVKVMRTNLTGCQKETESKGITRELRVWARLEHECVLPLYGISFDFGKFPAMVCPWLEGGTLSKYLEHHEGLELHTQLQLLSDIANGLHYLHGCGIVHGDLTGSNVLIKDNGKACLSDFGLSRIFMEATGSSYLTSTVRGSVRWAAPELFELAEDHQTEPSHALPSPQSDVYSFGSTMLQVLTGKVPYHYYTYDAQVLIALSRGLRPVRPDEPPIDDTHWEFMQRCWSSQSKRLGKHVRPSIEEVVDFLTVARARCSQG